MKTKNGFVWALVLLLLGLSAFLLFDKIQKTDQKKAVYQSIPEFQLPDMNGNIVTSVSLQKHRTVIFLFFNPDCDLCREEMIQIQTHQAALAQGQMVFFSTSPADTIQHFLQAIRFEPAPSSLFLSDEKEVLTNRMAVKMAPTIYIYRQGLLIKRFDGPVKIETLIRYLSEE